METRCLNCNTLLEIQITDININSLPQVECTNCKSIYNVTLKVELFPAPQRVEETPEEDSQTVAEPLELNLRNNNVVISIAGLATREVLRDILSYGKLQSHTVGKNDNIAEQVLTIDPAIMIIDIDMLTHHGIDIIENIKAASDSDIKVLLLASIHRKDRYKRNPENLFGADGYIERHELRSDLLQRLNNLAIGKIEEKRSLLHEISSEETITKTTITEEAIAEDAATEDEIAEDAVTEDEIAEEVKQPFTPTIVPEPTPSTAEPTEKQNEEIEAARRLARIIISDIALYNNSKIEDGIRNGTFFNLLKEEIEEGKKLYHSRVSKDIQEHGNFYKEAIMNFIKSKKVQLSKI